jgi:hypothetical protein
MRIIFFRRLDRKFVQFSSADSTQVLVIFFCRLSSVFFWSHALLSFWRSQPGVTNSKQYSAGCCTTAAAAATLNWICMTECRRADLPLPQHPLRSAISVTTTLSYPFPINFSTIPYYPLCSTRILTALSHTVETSSKQPWSVCSIYLPHCGKVLR